MVYLLWHNLSADVHIYTVYTYIHVCQEILSTVLITHSSVLKSDVLSPDYGDCE